MSLKQSTPNSVQDAGNPVQEANQKRHAYYKSSEFREAITDAFHKAKLNALDEQAVAEEKGISDRNRRCRKNHVS